MIRKENKIVDGPSKWEMMLSLFHGEIVSFRLDHKRSNHVLAGKITELSHSPGEWQDGRFENWNFKMSYNLGAQMANGRFSTATHKGVVIFDKYNNPELVKGGRV